MATKVTSPDVRQLRQRHLRWLPQVRTADEGLINDDTVMFPLTAACPTTTFQSRDERSLLRAANLGPDVITNTASDEPARTIPYTDGGASSIRTRVQPRQALPDRSRFADWPPRPGRDAKAYVLGTNIHPVGRDRPSEGTVKDTVFPHNYQSVSNGDAIGRHQRVRLHAAGDVTL